MKTVLIGSGNVATHLGNALHAIGDVVQVMSPNAEHAASLASKFSATSTDQWDAIRTDADLYLVAVRDDVLAEVSHKLPAVTGIVAHTSGSQPISVLEQHTDHGVFYPLQTFSKGVEMDLKQVPLCIEGSSPEVSEKLTNWARHVSNVVHAVSSEQRLWLHLAAVFANNFTNHMLAIAQRMATEKELPATLLEPLIAETVRKAQATSPETAQTGPARRQDERTLQQHVKLLAERYPETEIYTLVSQSIERWYHE